MADVTYKGYVPMTLGGVTVHVHESNVDSYRGYGFLAEGDEPKATDDAPSLPVVEDENPTIEQMTEPLKAEAAADEVEEPKRTSRRKS